MPESPEDVGVLYYAHMRRKIPTTFTVEFEQLERLGRISERTNLGRSSIVRSALEKELRHFEAVLGITSSAKGEEVIHVDL